MYFDNEMEEDAHMDCATTLGLNDIEGPDSLLEDSSVEELNNNMEGETGSSSSTSLPVKSPSHHRSAGGPSGGPGTVQATRAFHHHHRLQIDSSPGPPMPTDSNRFVEIVKNKLKLNQRPRNSPLTLSFPTKALDIQQRLVMEQEEELMDHLLRYNELKSDKEEELQLKEHIKELASKLEEVKLANAQHKKKYGKEMKSAKEDKETVNKRYQRQLSKKAALEETLSKKKNNMEKVQQKLAACLAEVKRQDEWFQNVGLNVLINSEEDTGSESANTSGSSAGKASEIFLQLTNINPNSPDEIFYIQMKTIDIVENKFKANNVHPSFDEAYYVIQEANKSQDFVKLLLDCKNYWLRQLIPLNSSQSSEPEEMRAVEADFTRPLFESPTSDGAGVDN